MPAIYLVRHGQASFGTADYDALSGLGRRQAVVAADEVARRGPRSPVVLSGTLRRQVDTAACIASRLGVELSPPDRRFDEFDAHGAVDAHLGSPGSTDGLTSAQFQVHLDEVISAWVDGADPGWTSFADGAWSALSDLAAALPPGCDGVVATSAGVTAALVAHALGCGSAGVVALNRASVNASITTFVSGARGVSLVTFNDHAHLLGEPGLRTSR